MPGTQMASIVVLVIGLGLLLAALFADFIGIGDDPGFGRQQMMGTGAGAVIAVVGLFLTLRRKLGPEKFSRPVCTVPDSIAGMNRAP